MPKFCANLSMLFAEVPFLDRFGAAAKAGFAGVEYWLPYAFPGDAIAERLERHRLTQALFNLPAGDWEGGERGVAVMPDRAGEFRDGVGKAIEYATALGCRQLNCLVGKTPPGVDAATVHETMIANLRFAARALEQAGIRLLVEAVNTQDVIKTVRDQVRRIAHMQIADNPGRHEPGTGEINFPNLFAAIDEAGYRGWIGLEYRPRTTAAEGLGWMRLYGGRQ